MLVWQLTPLPIRLMLFKSTETHVRFFFFLAVLTIPLVESCDAAGPDDWDPADCGVISAGAGVAELRCPSGAAPTSEGAAAASLS